MTTYEANGVRLGVEHFGDAAAPLPLCAGGTTMRGRPLESRHRQVKYRNNVIEEDHGRWNRTPGPKRCI